MLRQWLRLLDPTILEMQNQPVTSPSSRLRLARALNGRCMHEEARAVVENALSMDGNDPDLWFERIMALGDHASAEEMEDLHRRLSAGRGQPKESAPVLRNLGFLRVSSSGARRPNGPCAGPWPWTAPIRGPWS